MELYYTLNYSYHKIYTTQMNRLQFIKHLNIYLRDDMTFVVDWALKTNNNKYIYIYRSTKKEEDVAEWFRRCDRDQDAEGFDIQFGR